MAGGLVDRDLSGAAAVPDLVLSGSEWELVAQASSPGQRWMKTTRRLAVPGGWLYQVSSYQGNPDRSASVAEALAFVPIPANAVSGEKPQGPQPRPPARDKTGG